MKKQRWKKSALSGVIEWTTPLWRTGTSAWQPFGEIFQRASVRCQECQRQIEQEPAIRYRDLYICPRCKAAFFQKVREGLAREEAAHYCGFWIRLCARLLDGLLLSAITVPLSLVNEAIIFRLYPFPGPGTGLSQFENTSALGTLLMIQAAFVLFGLLIAFTYESILLVGTAVHQASYCSECGSSGPIPPTDLPESGNPIFWKSAE